jgi:hypothetical protein
MVHILENSRVSLCFMKDSSRFTWRLQIWVITGSKPSILTHATGVTYLLPGEIFEAKTVTF